MINAILYLDSTELAEELAKEFLQRGLAASTSIDIDNRYFVLDKGEVKNTIHTVLTLQTKALLFKEICEYVTSRLGKDVPVFTLPITQTNDYFYHFVQGGTQAR